MVELMAMRQIARVIGYAYELTEAVRHRSPIPSESLASAAAPLQAHAASAMPPMCHSSGVPQPRDWWIRLLLQSPASSACRPAALAAGLPSAWHPAHRPCGTSILLRRAQKCPHLQVRAHCPGMSQAAVLAFEDRGESVLEINSRRSRIRGMRSCKESGN
jgi:hypothetical protein